MFSYREPMLSNASVLMVFTPLREQRLELAHVSAGIQGDSVNIPDKPISETLLHQVSLNNRILYR